MALSVPVAGVPLSSVGLPVEVPVMTGASFAPWIVSVMSWLVPSTVSTVIVSIRVSPAFSASTAGLASSIV